MSSTNKTANLQLNQWVGTDPVLMSDFNADNQKIDTAIQTIGDTLTSELGALKSGLLKMATGSYKGTNKSGQANPNTLSFDFAPQLVIVSYTVNVAIFTRGCNKASVFYAVNPTLGGAMPNGWYIPNVSWGENSLSWYTSEGSTPLESQLNHGAYTYNHIAFGL